MVDTNNKVRFELDQEQSNLLILKKYENDIEVATVEMEFHE